MHLLKNFILLFSLTFSFSAHGQSGIGDTTGKPNTASVILFQFTENGIGFGGSYERLLDRKGALAFYIPVMATFNVANSNRIYDYNTGNYNTGKADAMFYTMPGIKYYAYRHHRVSYATGASLVIGDGKESNYEANIGGLNETEQVQSHFITGLMWQNSATINIDHHLCISTDIGIGSSLVNKIGGANTTNEFLIQGSVKIGYRF